MRWTVGLLAVLVACGLIWWIAGQDAPREQGMNSSASDLPGHPNGTSLEVHRPRLGHGGIKGSGDAARRGDARVRVTSRLGAGLGGVAVHVVEGDTTRRFETNIHGVAVLSDVPQDGSAFVRLFLKLSEATKGAAPRALSAAGEGPQGTPITGRTMELSVAKALPLSMAVVDAETGRQVQEAKWELVQDRRASDPPVVFPSVKGTTAFLTEVTPPPGWVAWDATAHYAVISPVAASIRAVYPLRRELETVVVLEDPSGAPAIAHRTQIALAGRKLAGLRFKTDALSRSHVRGVAFLASEWLLLRCESKDGTAGVTTRVRLPATADEPLVVTARLSSLFYNDGLVPPRETLFAGRWPSASGKPRAAERGEARLELVVRRRDGRVASGAAVILGDSRWKAGPDGRVAIEGLAEGMHRVRVQQVGFVSIDRQLRAERRGAAIELGEPIGCALRVIVEDDQRRPLPYATVRIQQASGVAWADLSDGVQRIDAFTDHRGVRTLRNVEPGKVRLRVRWGGRQRMQVVDARADGPETQEVRVVLAPLPARD